MAIGLADIIAYEKRRRATGQYVPEKFLSSAMEAYWDVEAQKAERAREFRLRERALGFEAERLRIAEEERKAAEKAQTIRGIADIGTTAAIGAYFLRGGATKTKTPVSTPSGAGGAGGAVGAKPLTYGGAGGAQRQFTSEVEPLFSNYTAEGAGGGSGAIAPVSSGMELYKIPDAEIVPPPTSPGLSTYLSAYGAGTVGGWLGSRLATSKTIQEGTPWGGAKTERKMGGVLGGAGAGFAVAGPIGAIIGGFAGFIASL